MKKETNETPYEEIKSTSHILVRRNDNFQNNFDELVPLYAHEQKSRADFLANGIFASSQITQSLVDDFTNFILHDNMLYANSALFKQVQAM